MKGRRKLLSIISAVAAFFVVVAAILLWPANDGRTVDERRRIAEACLGMLRSSLANEAEIGVSDSRIPEAIRELRPVHIELAEGDAVVMREGKPAEYHLSRSPSDRKTWKLFIAGPGYFGHREVFRMERE